MSMSQAIIQAQFPFVFLGQKGGNNPLVIHESFFAWKILPDHLQEGSKGLRRFNKIMNTSSQAQFPFQVYYFAEHLNLHILQLFWFTYSLGLSMSKVFCFF